MQQSFHAICCFLCNRSQSSQGDEFSISPRLWPRNSALDTPARQLAAVRRSKEQGRRLPWEVSKPSMCPAVSDRTICVHLLPQCCHSMRTDKCWPGSISAVFEQLAGACHEQAGRPHRPMLVSQLAVGTSPGYRLPGQLGIVMVVNEPFGNKPVIYPQYVRSRFWQFLEGALGVTHVFGT